MNLHVRADMTERRLAAILPDLSLAHARHHRSWHLLHLMVMSSPAAEAYNHAPEPQLTNASILFSPTWHRSNALNVRRRSTAHEEWRKSASAGEIGAVSYSGLPYRAREMYAVGGGGDFVSSGSREVGRGEGRSCTVLTHLSFDRDRRGGVSDTYIGIPMSPI